MWAIGDRSLLDHLAAIDHRDIVADIADDAEIVADKKVGEAEVGSSRIRNSRLTATARPMPMGCRCPPEKSYGIGVAFKLKPDVTRSVPIRFKVFADKAVGSGATFR